MCFTFFPLGAEKSEAVDYWMLSDSAISYQLKSDTLSASL